VKFEFVSHTWFVSSIWMLLPEQLEVAKDSQFIITLLDWASPFETRRSTKKRMAFIWNTNWQEKHKQSNGSFFRLKNLKVVGIETFSKRKFRSIFTYNNETIKFWPKKRFSEQIHNFVVVFVVVFHF